MILSVAPALPLQSLLTPLSIKRTLYGSSQTHGLLSLALTNNEYYDITVGYFESLPGLVTLWAHTMTAEVNGTRRGMPIFLHLSRLTFNPCRQLDIGHIIPPAPATDKWPKVTIDASSDVDYPCQEYSPPFHGSQQSLPKIY